MLVHPVIAESYATVLGGPEADSAADAELAAVAVGCSDLLERFAAVSDGRSEQGRDHPVAVVLVLCAAAVVAGMRSFTAVAGWVADVPAALRAQLYEPSGRSRPGGGPSKVTIWRVVTEADAAAVDAVVGAWLAGRPGHAGCRRARRPR